MAALKSLLSYTSCPGQHCHRVDRQHKSGKFTITPGVKGQRSGICWVSLPEAARQPQQFHYSLRLDQLKLSADRCLITFIKN